jgi:salicylate hydroxylase
MGQALGFDKVPLVKLGIVGAGIGGLTAALAARVRLGDACEVVVLERAERLEEAGAGLQLSPNATRALHRLGMAEALAAVGSAPKAIEVRTATGAHLLHRTELGPAAVERWGGPYLHVHRADLQQALLRALHDIGGVDVRTGCPVGAIGRDERGVAILLETGDVVAADVAVGADGLRSAVRSALHGHGRPRFTGQAAWRALVPAEKLPPGLAAKPTVWTGAGRHIVHYPLRGGTLINFVAVSAARDPGLESWAQRGDPVALAVAFGGWPSPVPELIAAAETVWRWPIYDRAPLNGWSLGRVTLLGDAAHPMPPYMAQGAAQAIEDAFALAAHLESGGEALPLALKAYEAERLPRTARVQAASRRNALAFHLPALLARPAFHWAEKSGAADLDWLYGGGPA